MCLRGRRLAWPLRPRRVVWVGARVASRME